MENVLNTIKSKVKTTKILAILGVVLIILGLFFNVGKLKPKVTDKEKFKSTNPYAAYYTLTDDQVKEAIKESEKEVWETTGIEYWGGYVMLILGVVGIALAYIDFIESKVPAETREKIKFWDKLKNIKLISVVAAVVLILLILTWKMPINKYYCEKEKVEMEDLSEEFDDLEKIGIKMKYSIESGFILIFIGSVALGAYPFFYKPEEKVQEATPVSQETTGNE